MKHTFLAVFVIVCLTSCSGFFDSKNSEKQKDEEWSDYAAKTVNFWDGRKMYLPKDLPIVSGDSSIGYDFNSVYSEPLKIVTYVDGGCGVCISSLKHWKKFIDDVYKKGGKCDFVFYIQAVDQDYFQKNVVDALGLKIKWIYDSDDKFITKNELFDQRFQTALLDKQDRVLMIGSIVFRPELEKLYKELILNKGEFDANQ